MNDFEKIKSNWKEQADQVPTEANFSELKNGIKNLAKKQRIGNLVLLSTIGVLVFFFIYIKAIEYRHVAMALGVMIAALFFRVLVEIFSMSHLRNLSIAVDTQNFKAKLENYYKNRMFIHGILTPVLLAIYSYAFWTLLPDFKISLSKGFYNYIVWSSLVLLVFFCFFLFFQIRKELRALKELE